MLYIMGIGLRGAMGLTMEEQDLLKKPGPVFFETYTSVSPASTLRDLERIIGRDVIPIGRNEVEDGSMLIELALTEDVFLLITGDPLSATTHNQLRADARDAGIEVRIIENASIISVIPGKIGLFPYKMGPPVSLPFLYDIFLPRSVCDKIGVNLKSGLHTILLLDLREGRTMYSYEAVEALFKLEEKYSIGTVKPETMIFSVSKVSQEGEKLIFDTAENIMKMRLEESPAALVIPSDLNYNEKYFVDKFTEKCDYFK